MRVCSCEEDDDMSTLKNALEEASKRSTETCSGLVDRIKGALYGLLIADALSHPTHWYYGGVRQVVQDWGNIQGYIAVPKEKILYGSIMGKSNTGGAGRGSDKGTIVGDVINHGKRKYWKSGSQYHYHQGLGAGENTLEACLTRNVIAQVVEDEGTFAPATQLASYVKFMTTPGTHNDTYASTAHRMFFKNVVERKRPPEKAADNDHHNVDTTDAVTMSVPIAVVAVSDEEAGRAAMRMVSLTRDSPTSQKLAGRFARLLRALVRGADLRETVREAGVSEGMGRLSSDLVSGREDPVTA